MNAFDILGDPVRRRIMELLLQGEQGSGDIVDVIAMEFGLSQPAVSYQLKVLRESGFAISRSEAQRRLYSFRPESMTELEEWLEPFRRFANHKLDALETEVARGKKVKSTPKI